MRSSHSKAAKLRVGTVSGMYQARNVAILPWAILSYDRSWHVPTTYRAALLPDRMPGLRGPVIVCDSGGGDDNVLL